MIQWVCGTSLRRLSQVTCRQSTRQAEGQMCSTGGRDIILITQSHI